MKLAERIAISYSHVCDEFSYEFIKRLHRAQGSTRMLVRNPNPDGQPYGVSNFKWLMQHRTEQELRQDPHHSKLFDYTLKYWS